MKIFLVVGFLTILLFPALSFAQDQKADDAAKERLRKLTAIVEQASADTRNLRLPENRAFFYCRIGNLEWPKDEERARALFQNAAAELITAQNFAESKRNANRNNELLTGGNTRQQILNIIAARSAELALELMVSTRPAAVQKALLSETQESTKIGNYSRGNNYIAQNEKQLEQNFYRMAAEQNPERAIAILKESLSKGLSNDTFYQLVRLAEKDGKAATEMSGVIIDKLLRSGFISDGQPLYVNIQLTNSILSHAMAKQSDSDAKLRFPDSQVRDLAARVISAYLSDQQIAPYMGGSIVAIAEKFSPGSVEQIRKRANVASNQNPPSSLDAAFQKLLEADTPPEQMLAAASKFSLDRRRQIYQSASNKFSGRGDTQSAREVLAENFDDETRDQMLTNFDVQSTYNLISLGKFSEAEQVIDGLTEDQRVSALVNLANAVFGKDQKENRNYALALLAKASQLTNERPENSSEMNMLMQVISGYSGIEPDSAFRIVEALIPKINELTEAAAVINGFQGNSNVRDGEFIMTQGDPFNNYGANSSMVDTLARSDFDRTMKLIDGFSRQEVRVSLKLQVAANGGLITSLPLLGRGDFIITNRYRR